MEVGPIFMPKTVELANMYLYRGETFGPGETEIPDHVIEARLSKAFRAAIDGEEKDFSGAGINMDPLQLPDVEPAGNPNEMTYTPYVEQIEREPAPEPARETEPLPYSPTVLAPEEEERRGDVQTLEADENGAEDDPHDDTPIEDLQSVPKDVEKALQASGYHNAGDLRDARDSDLLAVDGIGPATFKAIREEVG